VSEVRVLVASSQPVLRQGIRATLNETPFRIWFEADDRGRAVEAAASGAPDVCLVDVELRDGGLMAVHEIVQRAPTAVVIVLADECTRALLLAAVRGGAVGFLGKDDEARTLPCAIEAVLAGEAAIPRRLVGGLLDAVKAGGMGEPRSTARLAGLTQREIEVLEMVCQGRSTKNIASLLFVAPVTIRTHVMSLMRKLHVRDREALVRSAGGPLPPWQTIEL
jgi:DNA-binding NarL/FixJ family response regulator